MNMIGGIGNLGGAANNPEGAKPSQGAQEQAQTPVFNPNANTGVSQAQAGLAAQARLVSQSKALTEEDEAKENQELNSEGNTQVEVFGLGLIELSQEQIDAFQQRVSDGIMAQEQMIEEAVGYFSGEEKNLRHVISTLLLSQ